MFINGTKTMEKKTNNRKRIAIQGGYGAFHEIAAKYYFQGEDIEIVPCDTFKDLFRSVKQRKSDFGIMAIENTLAGSIIPNYKLIHESSKKIIGEIYLRIVQNLVALPGQKIKDLTEVYSHPIAIMQCQAFFDKYPNIRLIDAIDTALSAKMIKEKNLIGIGAITSDIAAQMYDMEILAEGIETNKFNYTRFWILEDGDGKNLTNKKANKASIYFSLAHQIGSLSKILSILSFYDMNLSKIQSLPIMGSDWQYFFYVDVEFSDYTRYKQSMDAIKPFTEEFGLLGEYTKGKAIM